MPVTPCWPCRLLFASHAGYSLPCRPYRLLLLTMPVTLCGRAGYSLPCRPCWLLLALCQPCWLFLAGHAGYSLPAMLIAPCLASQASYSLLATPAMLVTLCRPCRLLFASHAGNSCWPCQLLFVAVLVTPCLAGHAGYSLLFASHAGYSLPCCWSCQPCRLLLSLPTLLATLCQPCWLLLSLPAMPVTHCWPCRLLLTSHAGTVPCWPCLPLNQLWTVALTHDFKQP